MLHDIHVMLLHSCYSLSNCSVSRIIRVVTIIIKKNKNNNNKERKMKKKKKKKKKKMLMKMKMKMMTIRGQ